MRSSPPDSSQQGEVQAVDKGQHGACLVLAAPADAGKPRDCPPSPTQAAASRLTGLSASKPAASEMRLQHLRWQLVAGESGSAPGPLCVSPGTPVNGDLSCSVGHEGPGRWLWVFISWPKEH